MAAPLKGSLPPDLDLGTGFLIQFTALDPNSGAVVGGVNVSGATMTVANVAGGDLAQLFTDDVPLWLDLPLNVFEAPSG